MVADTVLILFTEILTKLLLKKKIFGTRGPELIGSNVEIETLNISTGKPFGDLRGITYHPLRIHGVIG